MEAGTGLSSLKETRPVLPIFLSTEMSQHYRTHPRSQLVVSGGSKEILKVRTFDTSRQLSSNHEEADTRIVLHARDATAEGYKQVNLLCRDTDVLVLQTNKISVKKSGCSLVHPEEKDTYWSTKSHCQRRRGSRC